MGSMGNGLLVKWVKWVIRVIRVIWVKGGILGYMRSMGLKGLYRVL